MVVSFDDAISKTMEVITGRAHRDFTRTSGNDIGSHMEIAGSVPEVCSMVCSLNGSNFRIVIYAGFRRCQGIVR